MHAAYESLGTNYVQAIGDRKTAPQDRAGRRAVLWPPLKVCHVSETKKVDWKSQALLALLSMTCIHIQKDRKVGGRFLRKISSEEGEG